MILRLIRKWRTRRAIKKAMVSISAVRTQGRWTTMSEIDDRVRENILPVFFRSVVIDERLPKPRKLKPPSFIVEVRLKWWTWLALGFLQLYYQHKLQALCDVGRPAAVLGIVVVR